VAKKFEDLIGLQDGVIARWQIAQCPHDLSAVDACLRRNTWQPLYRGVYATYSGRTARKSILWAAVLRCGRDAVLSHYTAAELENIGAISAGAVHVTIPLEARARISTLERGGDVPAIVVHRSSRLDATRHPAKAPPRTRLPETILDLTDVSESFDKAFGWLSVACGGRMVKPHQLRDAAIARPKLRWRSAILGALADVAEGVHSNLELKYLKDVERAHGLPAATRQAQQTLGARSAYQDNLYEDFGVGVELDGLAAHPAERRWDDIRRDNFFASRGVTTLRYNWADITERPCAVASQVAAALRKHGWTGTPRRCGPGCKVRAD
jgi:very-short-patch-repair endonuclease